MMRLTSRFFRARTAKATAVYVFQFPRSHGKDQIIFYRSFDELVLIHSFCLDDSPVGPVKNDLVFKQGMVDLPGILRLDQVIECSLIQCFIGADIGENGLKFIFKLVHYVVWTHDLDGMSACDDFQRRKVGADLF